MYFGGLPWSVTSEELETFVINGFGNISSAEVVIGHDGRSRGYGIVQAYSEDDATQIISTFNDSELQGRRLFVKFDGDKSGNSGYNNGSNGYNSGYNNGSNGGYNNGNGGYNNGSNGYNNGSNGYNNGSNGYNKSSNYAAIPPVSKSVYFGGLPWSVTSEELEAFVVSGYGNVNSAKVIIGSDGRSRGYGIIEAQSEHDAAQIILTFNEMEFQGRRLFVKFDGAM